MELLVGIFIAITAIIWILLVALYMRGLSRDIWHEFNRARKGEE